MCQKKKTVRGNLTKRNLKHEKRTIYLVILIRMFFFSTSAEKELKQKRLLITSNVTLTLSSLSLSFYFLAKNDIFSLK